MSVPALEHLRNCMLREGGGGGGVNGFGKFSSPDNARRRLKSYLCTLCMFTVKQKKIKNGQGEGGCRKTLSSSLLEPPGRV